MELRHERLFHAAAHLPPCVAFFATVACGARKSGRLGYTAHDVAGKTFDDSR
jgi:hypothetical protein